MIEKSAAARHDRLNAQSSGAVRYLVQRLLLLMLFAVILFIAAGTWHSHRAWAYVLAVLIFEGLTLSILAWRAPHTLKQRGHIGARVKPFDRVFIALWLVLALITPVVAGLETRAGAPALPWLWFYVGLATLTLASLFGLWAMVANEHFEQFVRIQTERGHRVVTTGPDQFVRHPGYLAAVVGALATPLMLGSIWTFAPAALIAALFVIRTILEDRTLRRELDGYEAYARRTRFRLVPGIW